MPVDKPHTSGSMPVKKFFQVHLKGSSSTVGGGSASSIPEVGHTDEIPTIKFTKARTTSTKELISAREDELSSPLND